MLLRLVFNGKIKLRSVEDIKVDMFYCPAVAGQYPTERILTECPFVAIRQRFLQGGIRYPYRIVVITCDIVFIYGWSRIYYWLFTVMRFQIIE